MSEKSGRIVSSSGGVIVGEARVPGDKSVTHRALILGALGGGDSRVSGWLRSGDTMATLGCVRALGVEVDDDGAGALVVRGRGLHGLREAASALNCVHAGTAMRLLAGVMAGQGFPSTLDGSSQLRARPMRRVTGPLRDMGAIVSDADGRAPLAFRPSRLGGIEHRMDVASAQVKSAILLAGLYAEGQSVVVEPGPSRDCTERMLRRMGADLRSETGRVTLVPGQPLAPFDIAVPGDPSSAAFLLAAAALTSGTVRVAGIDASPTRSGFLDILAAMGARIRVSPTAGDSGAGDCCDVGLSSGVLHGVEVGGTLVVRSIDEFPALMVLATQAEGVTEVKEASELRVKETDRIAVMASELRKLGAVIEERPDGFLVRGPQRLRGAVVDGHDDHRVAMSLALAGLVADGETVVGDAACADDSFPGFVQTLASLGARIARLADA
ncbi:MAG: 3-phosphoshikimate 1-carboxyvinyltransferase [Spirochaetes bacterium]|nr:3-phosphoshikimate 1-carboxyvinyltransferase [Spirochaetota bacterium]